MDKYLEETKLLNFSSRSISELINKKQWRKLNDYDKILKTYNFVRDDIIFGYNEDDAIPASKVLQDGYGQCNTKGILFMALLRGVNIKCRMHGFTIDKKLQKGAIKSFYYSLSPKEIVHSWVEIYYDSHWYNLEGFILDADYLSKLQRKFSNCTGSFCGYGAATKNFQNPEIDWNINDTYIQSEGIVRDLGVFDSPDEFLKEHHQAINLIKKFIYRKFVRHLMNRNINCIRNSREEHSMKDKNKIKLSKEKREDMISAIKNYFSEEREEELGDLAADLILDFIIDKLAPEFYNQGVYDSYKYMSDRIEDVLSIQKY